MWTIVYKYLKNVALISKFLLNILGIGRGIAVQLGEAGATVYITGRSVDKLKECADEIQKRGGKVNFLNIFLKKFSEDTSKLVCSISNHDLLFMKK